MKNETVTTQSTEATEVTTQATQSTQVTAGRKKGLHRAVQVRSAALTEEQKEQIISEYEEWYSESTSEYGVGLLLANHFSQKLGISQRSYYRLLLVFEREGLDPFLGLFLVFRQQHLCSSKLPRMTQAKNLLGMCKQVYATMSYPQ
jgi:hypothetical protein